MDVYRKAKRMKRFGVAAVIVLLFYASLLNMGCTGKESSGPNFMEMTPKQQVTVMYDTYNSQAADYRSQLGYIQSPDGKWVKNHEPTLTDLDKRVLRAKKEALEIAYPMITAFDAYVVTGTSPPPQMAFRIMEKLNELILPMITD